MRILSIGNSFSQDAQRYLHRVAKCHNLQIDSVNLMIGGCSLETHYRNMLSEEKNYDLEFNGENTGFKTSIKEALLSGHWDVVTLQQVSHKAPYFSTFEHYAEELSEYIRKYAPSAKIVIQQTWAYEEGSKRLCEELKYSKASDMLADIVSSYEKMSKAINADAIIPSGEMLYKLHENGIEKVHRDTFHASLGAGRYALALLWLRKLCGVSISEDQYNDFDEPVTDAERQIIRSTVNSF